MAPSYYLFLVINIIVLFKSNFGNNLDINPYFPYSRNSRGSAFCPSNTQCVPISSCPILNDIIRQDCVLTNRIGSLSCGYQGSGLICCPQANSENTIITPGSAIFNSGVLNTGNNNNNNKFVDGHVCGQSSIQGDNYNGLGAFPFIARIGFRSTITGESKYPCTGSILSRRVILTAAHCALAKAENYKLFSVRIGEYLINSDIDCGREFCSLPVQDIAISHVIIHPGYDKSTYRKNIALLVLRSTINFTVTAQPICLPETWSVTNNNGILVGWGKLAGQTVMSNEQQVLRLPIVSNQQCASVYGQTLPITDDNTCAGGEKGNDACSGFGGAPLIVQHGETFYQVGILSFGSDQCGAAGIPSVYINIKKYVTWIKENMPRLYNN